MARIDDFTCRSGRSWFMCSRIFRHHEVLIESSVRLTAAAAAGLEAMIGFCREEPIACDSDHVGPRCSAPPTPPAPPMSHPEPRHAPAGPEAWCSAKDAALKAPMTGWPAKRAPDSSHMHACTHPAAGYCSRATRPLSHLHTCQGTIEGMDEDAGGSVAEALRRTYHVWDASEREPLSCNIRHPHR